jgi:threonine dehydrogenase-like Zn-dependent dehydrogenase
VDENDRVAVNPMVTCGECYYCRRGEEDLCERWRSGEAGYGTIGRARDGGFAEYVLAPSDNLVTLPDSVDNRVGSILVDACATSFNSVQKADIDFGDTVVVYGVGGLGSCAIKYLSLVEHLKLVAVDLKANALSRAQNLGADVTLDATETNVVEEISALTEGRGADTVFEFTGGPPAMEKAVTSLRPGGTAIITGCAEEPWEIPGSTCCLDAVNVRGSHGFTHEQIEQLVTLVSEGTLQFQDILTHEFPLEEANKAINYLEDNSRADENVGRITISIE